MKPSKLLAILIAITLITSGITIMVYHATRLVGVESVTASVVVGDHLGFDVSTDSLTFGMVTSGSSSVQRHVELANHNNFPIKITVRTTGEMREWIQASPQPLLVEPNNRGRINFVTTPPADSPHGNYTGIVDFIYEKI